MAIKKSLMVAGALATVGLASVAGLSTVSAATDSTNKTSIVEKIATKFNLNKDDVQKVFDEERAEHQAEHKAKLEERLTQAVTDGKLTEDQKSKILAKLDELEQKREEVKSQLEGKTKEERRDLMEDQRDTLEDWADENDIPMEYLRMAGPGKGRGPGGHGLRQVKN